MEHEATRGGGGGGEEEEEIEEKKKERKKKKKKKEKKEEERRVYACVLCTGLTSVSPQRRAHRATSHTLASGESCSGNRPIRPFRYLRLFCFVLCFFVVVKISIAFLLFSLFFLLLSEFFPPIRSELSNQLFCARVALKKYALFPATEWLVPCAAYCGHVLRVCVCVCACVCRLFAMPCTCVLCAVYCVYTVHSSF